MPVLFTQNWDILQDKEDDYATFVTQEYMPRMTDLGLTPVGGYYVEVGFGPRIVAVHSAETSEELACLMKTAAFKDLSMELKSFVHNVRRAVLEPTGNVKKQIYAIQKGVWKFNQYYDLRPGVKKSYAEFIITEQLRLLEKIEYVEVTGGWNVVIGGISEIIAELTFKDPLDIGRLLSNEEFRKLTLKLRTRFVTNYASRIMRCTERFDEPKWFRL